MHREFLRTHLWIPLAVFVVLFGIIEGMGLDLRLARSWFYDVASGHWLGTGSGEWWARSILHQGGRWLPRIVVFLAVGTWAASFFLKSLRHTRQSAGFVALAMISSMAVVGGLKAITHVDCPWDLQGFGGDNPYIGLLAARPAWLPHAACFPGSHSSSGFSLVCFYFLWRGRSRRLAAWGLAAGIVVGLAFAFAQEARGAHFLSHDLASAAIVWFVQLGLYRLLLPGRYPAASERKCTDIAVPSASLPVPISTRAP